MLATPESDSSGDVLHHSPQLLLWDGVMADSAHSSFFGLDLNFDAAAFANPDPTSTDLRAPGQAPSKPPQRSKDSSPVKDAKIEKKTFHFVENSDKKTATRLRNTLASRNLRQSKLSRIAELERMLEEQQKETELWRKRATEAGWIE